MACKPFNEQYEEVKDVMSKEEFKKVYDALKDAGYEELVDTYEAGKADVLDMLNGARPYMDRQRVELVDVRKTGESGYKIEYKYLTSDKVYKKTVGENRITFGQEGMTFEMGTRELDRLYSDKEFVNEGKVGYDKIVLDMMNEPGKMVELAKEIEEISTVKSKNAKQLIKNLEMVVPELGKLMPEISVYLNKQGKKNGGFVEFDGTRADIYTSVGPDNRNKSALEAFVHEVYHAATKFALESGDPALGKVLAGLKDIKNQFLEEANVEEMIKDMPDQSKAREQVEKMLDYFADVKVGLHEFVAYAMTNPAVMKQLEKMQTKKVREEHPDLASKLIGIVRRLVEKLTDALRMRHGDKNSYTDTVLLVSRLAQANNRVLEAKRSAAVEGIAKAITMADTKVKEFATKQLKKVTSRPMPRMISNSKWEVAKYWSKMLPRALVDENAKRSIEAAAGFAGLSPEGSVMTTMRDMSESDDFQDAIEKMGLIGQNIDQYREFEYTQTALTLKKGFSRELTDAESIGLTDVLLDADVGVLWGEYDVKKLLDDEKELDKQIKELDQELKDSVAIEDYRSYREQYRGLGYYMVTGKASMIQLLNAENIARNLNSLDRRNDNVSKEVVEKIDKLASLEALRHVNEDSKKTISKLMEDEANGVDLMVAYQIAHKEKAQEKLFNSKSDRQKLIKGYSKEIFPKDVDMQIDTVGNESAMRKLGYKLVKRLGKNKLDGNSAEMAMYVSTMQVKQNLHRVAMRYTDMGRKGTSIREGYGIAGDKMSNEKARRDIAKMKLKMYEMVKAIEDGKKDVVSGNEFGLVPVMDNAGNVADFRYMISKEDKVNVLKMDRRAVHVVGRTYASTYDKEKTQTFNDTLMGLIEEDAAKNVGKDQTLGRNSKEYVKISKDSTSAEIRDLWSVLPDSLKAKHKDGFMIRRDMMHSALGYREATLANFPGMDPLPEGVKYGVRVAEMIWKEIVKVAKVDIILRVPAVIVGNVVSNFMYSLTSGYSPLEIAKLQMQGVKDLNEFIAKTKEIIRLENLINAGKHKAGDERRLSAMKNDLQSNPAKDLVDEGFYMTIIEEVGLEEFGTSNKFTQFMEDKLKSVPEIIRDGINLLYLNERTTVFKTLNMATQYSDFVARYAQYHLMVKSGIEKEQAVKTVRDAFVNYNKPNSRLIEWANQMGLVMFTKYFTRIQKAIKQHFKDHPVLEMLMLAGHEMVLPDVNEIHDQSLFVKNYGSLFYNPLENLIRAVTPTGAEVVSEILKHTK